MIIILPGDVPSKKNSKQIVWNKKTNRPFIMSSKNHADWHKVAMLILKGTGFCGKKIQQTNITAVFYPSTKRKFDVSNKWESIGDLLVDSEIIEDDNWSVIPNLSLKFGGQDKENPRTEIYFHDRKD